MSRPLHVCWALGLVALLAACGGGADGDGSSATPTGGVLRVLVRDAPFPIALVEEASVVIERVEARDRDMNSWVVLFEGEATLNLVELTGDAVALLVAATPPPGAYDEFRLIVDAGSVVLAEEAVSQRPDRIFTVANGGLHFPSGAQTGIKVKVEPPVVVTTTLSGAVTFDFALDRNFVFNGPVDRVPGVRRVIFTPTIQAVNSAAAGTVLLTVLTDLATPDDDTDDAPLGGAGVTALDGMGTEVGGGLTNGAGVVALDLPPGTYDLVLEASGHATRTIEDVPVVLGNLTDLGPVTLAATAGEISGVVTSDNATSDGADDRVLAGALVEARAAGDSVVVATATSDESGVYRFDSLAPGAYDLAFSREGFVGGLLAGLVASAGATNDADITLAALTENLAGTVSDAAGTGLPNVTVTATDPAGNAFSTTTAADGTYSLSLATGTYDVVFDDGAGTTHTASAVVILGADPATDEILDVTL